MSRIPPIPGQILTSPEQCHSLKSLVQELCQTRSKSFPGSQPVSFGWKSLQALEKEDYWVCEKSDGVRCLLLILTNGTTNEQETYFIDRKNVYRRIRGLYFPNYKDSTLLTPANKTLIDGELVIDHDKKSGKDKLRYLVFDLLVLETEDIYNMRLGSRYGRLRSWVVEPFLKSLAKRGNPSQPLEIKLKVMDLAYAIDHVFKTHIPNLQHGNDGLIFTCVESGYVFGTDSRIIKWKDPSENSIDFRISLRFSASDDNTNTCDFAKKPLCELQQWEGGKLYNWFDNWDISEEEWQNFLKDGIDLHNKIAEFSWMKNEENWRFLRFRDDKNDANHSTVVEKVTESIEDGVEAHQLIKKSSRIRSEWKSRAQRRGIGMPVHSKSPPQSTAQPYKLNT
ncbi:hypothetical protein E3P81_00829 [Wallemia ichthyophaga]|nr:hypothetical protein E3P97_00830 [Wallemia ichthyophaga]TIB34981.1 hypothetical protein E3P85_00595 [Wallemia ichthyophaga]TIB49695.1 hypothetical protein E3P82_00827 [Wallemia ichthyophaga]TIB53410.1 hypothetical protein E3P81_00829 [Wallemia ichthyophaga]TIB56064.1 hypothetical protein E3P80_00828 [Wallemia ichthyophaga]